MKFDAREEAEFNSFRIVPAIRTSYKNSCCNYSGPDGNPYTRTH